MKHKNVRWLESGAVAAAAAPATYRPVTRSNESQLHAAQMQLDASAKVRLLHPALVCPPPLIRKPLLDAVLDNSVLLYQLHVDALTPLWEGPIVADDGGVRTSDPYAWSARLHAVEQDATRAQEEGRVQKRFKSWAEVEPGDQQVHRIAFRYPPPFCCLPLTPPRTLLPCRLTSPSKLKWRSSCRRRSVSNMHLKKHCPGRHHLRRHLHRLLHRPWLPLHRLHRRLCQHIADGHCCPLWLVAFGLSRRAAPPPTTQSARSSSNPTLVTRLNERQP